MRYTVYKTTNTVNGKIYVGHHATENPNDSYLGSGILLKKAIRKYGRQAFCKEVLFDFDNSAEMVAKERAIVDKDFVSRDDTYNLARGGKSPFTDMPREQVAMWARVSNKKQWEAIRKDPSRDSERRRRAGAAMKRHHADGKIRYDTFNGRTHTEESKLKMSQAAKKRTGERNSQFGTAWVCKVGFKPRKVVREDLDRWLAEGWQHGRKAH